MEPRKGLTWRLCFRASGSYLTIDLLVHVWTKQNNLGPGLRTTCQGAFAPRVIRPERIQHANESHE